MWEKRLNENYFKLFRKRTERKLERGKNGKVNAKQEMGNAKKEKEAKEGERECAPLCEQWQCCQSATISAEGEGEPEGNFVDKGKG